MRLILLMLALGVFFLSVWMLFADRFESIWHLEALVERFDATKSWAWLFGILLLLLDLFLPIPGTIVMSALGAVYGFWLGGLVAAGGSILAGMLGYGAGRFFDETFARKWLGENDFDKGKGLFERSGAWVVAISRALPILPEVLACMAGLLRMPFGKFVIALACGAIPMGFLFAWVGDIGRQQPEWTVAFSMLIPALLWWVATIWGRHASR